MAINLGDVNFRLGADARSLGKSVKILKDFGKEVDRATNLTSKGASTVASAFRKQEKAAADALRTVVNMNQRFRNSDFGTKLVRQSNKAFRDYNATLTSGQLTTVDFQRAQVQFRNSLASTSREFRKLKEEAKGAQNPTSKLTTILRDMASTSVLISGPLGGVAARLTTLANVSRSGGAAVAALLAGVAGGAFVFQKFGSAIVQTGQQFISFEQQLLSISGNLIVAKASMQDIIDIGRDTGQIISSIVPAFARFSAAAKGTSIEGQNATEIFRSVSLVMSKLQAPAEQVNGVFRALEQIMSKGQVQAEELRGQLGDRLPGAVQIAARAMGVSTVRLNEMLKAGEVLSEEFLPKLAKELRKTFGLEGVDSIDNFQTSMNDMRNAFDLLLVRFNEISGASLKVKTGIDLITSGLDFLATNVEVVIGLVGALTGALIGLAAPVIFTSIGGLISLTRTLTTAIASLNFVMLLNPAGALVAGLGRLATVIAGGTVGYLAFKSAVSSSNIAMATGGQQIDDFISDFDELGRASKESARVLIRNVQRTIEALNEQKEAIRDQAQPSFADSNQIDFLDGLRRTLNQLPVVGNLITTDNEAWAEAVTIFDDLKRQIDANVVRLNRLKEIEAELENPDPIFGKSFINAKRNIEALIFDLEGLKRIASSGPNLKDILRAEDLEKARETVKDLGEKEIAALDNILIEAGFSAGSLVGNLGSLITTTREYEETIDKLKERATTEKEYQLALDETTRRIEALGEGTRAVERLENALRIEGTIRSMRKELEEAGFSSDEVTMKLSTLSLALQDLDAAELAAEKVNASMEAINEVGGNAVDNFFTTLIDDARQGELSLASLADFADSVVTDIINTFTRLAVINPIKNALFGGTAGRAGLPTIDFSSLFAGGFAKGGFIPPGKFGLTGENGPEIVEGGRTGRTITPINDNNSEGNITVNQNNYFSVGLNAEVRSEIAKELPKVQKAAEEGVANRIARGGGFNKRMRA